MVVESQADAVTLTRITARGHADINSKSAFGGIFRLLDLDYHLFQRDPLAFFD